MLPIFAAFVSHYSGPAQRYEQVIENFAWGRWQAVIDLLRSPNKIPHDEVTLRRASALAGLGKLAEAISMIEPLANEDVMPYWLYCSRASEVYSIAGDHETAFEFLEKAVENAPMNSTALIDLAMACVKRRREVDRAEKLLGRVDPATLADMTGPFFDYVNGVIELRRGNPKQAIDKIEEVIPRVQVYRHASPLVGLWLDEFHTMLAIAYATIGEYETSRSLFVQSRPRLLALRNIYLIDDYLEADPTFNTGNSQDPYRPPAVIG